MKRITAVCFLACLVTASATAQTSSKPSRIWGALGLGAAAPSSGGDGIANMAEIVFEKDPHHFAVRGLIVHDIDRPVNELGEVGVLYGLTRSMSSIAVGAAGVGFSTCPDDDDSCFTIGVPLVAEVSRSRRNIGIGIQAFGNLNSKASYAGAVLFVQLGRLRQ